MEDTAKKPGGKREGQKYKSLLVWDILQKSTDENHPIHLKIHQPLHFEQAIQNHATLI